MNQRIRCVKPFPNRLDAAKTVDDPFVAFHQCRMRLKIFFVRDVATVRPGCHFIDYVKRQSGYCRQLTGKR